MAAVRFHRHAEISATRGAKHGEAAAMERTAGGGLKRRGVVGIAIVHGQQPTGAGNVAADFSRDSNGYSLWARQVAEQTGAGFIPLHDLVADEYDKLGTEATKPLFNGDDHTHTAPAGAKITSRILAKAIRGLGGISLGEHLLPAAGAQHPIRAHGAVGDGVTLDTAAIPDEKCKLLENLCLKFQESPSASFAITSARVHAFLGGGSCDL